MTPATVERTEISIDPPSVAFKTCFDLLFTLIDLDITLVRLVVLASIACHSACRISDEEEALATAISGHEFFHRGFVRRVMSDIGRVDSDVDEAATGELSVDGAEWDCHCPISSSEIREAQLEAICTEFKEWLESLSERFDPTSAESANVDRRMGIRPRGGAGSHIGHEGEVVDERKKTIWQKVKVEMSHAYNVAKGMIQSTSMTSTHPDRTSDFSHIETPRVDSYSHPRMATWLEQEATGQIPKGKEWIGETNLFSTTKDMLGQLVKSARSVADHKLRENGSRQMRLGDLQANARVDAQSDVVNDVFGSRVHSSKTTDDGLKLHLVAFSVAVPTRSKTSRMRTTVPEPFSHTVTRDADEGRGGRHGEGIPVEPSEPREKVFLWAVIGSGRCLPVSWSPSLSSLGRATSTGTPGHARTTRHPFDRADSHLKSTTSSNTTLLSCSRPTSSKSRLHTHAQVHTVPRSEAPAHAETTSFTVLPRFGSCDRANRPSGATAFMSAWYPDLIASLSMSNVGAHRDQQSEGEGDVGSTVPREVVAVICAKILEYELPATARTSTTRGREQM